MKRTIKLAIAALFTLSLFHSFTSFAQQTTLTVDCHAFKTVKEGEKVMLFVGAKNGYDSTYVKDHQAVFTLKKEDISECCLLLPEQEKKPNMLVYLDNCNTTITLDGTTYNSFNNEFLGNTVTGNPQHNLVMELNNMIFHAPADKDPFDDGTVKNGLLEACKRADLAAAYVLAKYCSAAAHFGMLNDIKDCLSCMSPEVLSTYPGRELQKQYEAYAPTAKGNKFIDFSMPTPDGKTLSVYEYIKDKKCVLIDFWASWCGPCRAEGKNVKAIYEDYKDKGFTVLGISLDTKKPAWEKAIAEEGYTWGQMSDLKGFESDIVKQLRISGIPQLYLIDSEGNVIATNLRGNDLRNKVAEVCK